MNYLIKTLNTVVLTAFLSAMGHAGDAPAPVSKDLQEAIEETNYVETAQPGIILSGYVDAGYIYNFTAGTMGQRWLGGDGDAHGDFELNQMKLVLEKPLSDANELQAGFRADLMFGEDAASFTSNASGSPDGDTLYVQQGYVQFRLPIGNGLDVLFGKHQQSLGWEAEERPANINITGGISALGDPGGTIGMLAIYPVNDYVELNFGVNNGSGADDNAGLDASDDDYAVTGQFTLFAPGGNASWSNGFNYSWGGGNISANDDHALILNSLGEWMPQFANDKLLFAYNFTYVFAEDFNPGGSNDSEYFGIGLYTKYYFTDIFSLGARAEYMHTDDQNIVGLTTTSGSNDLWSLTGTLGFDLLENLLIRAEYRVDLGNDVAVDGTNTDDLVHTLASEVTYSF
ncbi:MAG: outer membrane beta-barrel protein [Verrucomicrobiota bacterium]